MPVEVISAGTLLSASLVGLPLSLAAERPWAAAPSVLSLGALALLGVLNTAGGYLLLFRLVVRAGAGFASLNNFLVPLFGVMRWMSASDKPPEAWMRICCSLPVALSLAWTLTMPLASMSKVTSICGMM